MITIPSPRAPWCALIAAEAIWLRTLALTLWLSALAVSAADHYVRPGASGNGTNWGNAYGQLPTNLIRGDTYYLAGGSYGDYTFDDPVSGTKIITIKKATVSAHGTDSGWQAAYADGQVIFASTLTFTTANWVLDGQTRNENDWFDGPAYGIRINHENQDQNLVISSGSSNISVKFVFIDAIMGNLPSQTVRRYAIDTDSYGGAIATGLLFHGMYVSGSNNVWFLRTTNGAIVEHCASQGASGNAANHGEIFNLYYSGNNAVIRYNRIKDAYIGGGATAIVAITFADGLSFYGNIVSNFSVGDGAVGFDGYASSHNRVYNNTFVGSVGGNAGTAWGSGTDNLVYNNLWVNCPTIGIAGVHDYNAFPDANAHGEAHAQTNVSPSLFHNYAAGDFRLAAATVQALTLPPPYHQDLAGAMRGADGAWDRGAYEFANSPTTTPPTVTTTAHGPGAAITGTTAALGALGGPAGSESAYTYTWNVVSSPAGGTATFSPNGSNAARNTTTTFTRAGTYHVQVAIANPTNGTTTISGPVTLTVSATFTSILVTGPATVVVNASAQFSAQGRDQFAQALAVQPSFTWSASSGTVTNAGLFTAAGTTGTQQVTAANGGKNGHADVAVTTAGTGDSSTASGKKCGIGGGLAAMLLGLGVAAGLQRRRCWRD